MNRTPYSTMDRADRPPSRQFPLHWTVIHIARQIARIVALPALLLTLTVVYGCGTVSVRAGSMPNVTALTAALKPGQSTGQDVMNALGPPAGRGGSMMPWQAARRTVWTYYYEEGQVGLGGSDSDDRRIFLFVFFEKDRYDGYLWFSSLEQ